MLNPGYSFYDRFIELCKDRCVTPCTVSRILGFSRSCVTDWKNNGTMPCQENVNKIAYFFNIIVDELMAPEKPDIATKLDEVQVRRYLLGEHDTDTNWIKVKQYIAQIKSNYKA